MLFEKISLTNILSISFVIRDSAEPSIFAGIYSLIWPILIEVIIFGFIFGILMEKFNPIRTSQMIAKQQEDHTVVIGYSHLGERIVDYLIENEKPFSVITIDKDSIQSLINEYKPIVIGDATDEVILENAAVQNAKEVFLLTNDAREAIVLCEKIRAMNKKCELYDRIFGDEYNDYLRKDPINAYSFSTSKWTMNSVEEWTKDEKGNVLIIGRDNLSQRIAEYVGISQNRTITIMDKDIDEDLYNFEKNIKTICDDPSRLNFIEEHLDLKEISQVFICWKEEEEFSNSLYLCNRFKEIYPKIKVYVRIFDEELAKIMDKFNATTFSTSSYAFEMLQKHVKKNSAIFLQ